jgi:superfamily I DNA/RNA helicase
VIAGRITGRLAKPVAAADREGEVSWLGSSEEVDLSAGTWLLLARTRALLKDLIDVARDQGVAYSVKGRSAVDVEHVAAILGYEKLRAGKEVNTDVAMRVLRAMGRRKELDDHAEHGATSLGIDARPIWHDALVGIPLEDREYYLACLRRGEKLTEPPRVRIETIHGAKGLEAENVLLRTDLSYRTSRGAEIDPDSEHRVFFVGATRASLRLFPVAAQGPYEYPL